MESTPNVSLDLSGTSAFVPVEAYDGRFTVLRLRYGGGVPHLERGAMSFQAAEKEALRQNRKAEIPDHVWWAIAERLKNADV